MDVDPDATKANGPELDLAAIAALDKKGEKKKKRKKSAADKSLEKLEQKSDELKNNAVEFKYFLAKVEQWINKPRTKERILRFFEQIDGENEGTVSFEEFKAGMLDLNAPCNSIEVHTMASILDIDDIKRVHYPLLEKGLQIARLNEETYEEENIRPQLPLTQTHHERCSKCSMLQYNGEDYWSKYPRYILVELRLAPFSKEDHPHHVTTLVKSHVTLAYLAKVIKDHTDLLTTQIYLFDSPDSEKVLPLDMRLEDDFVGGTWDNPTKVTLYYEYKSEFFECPLLMADYYIGQRQRGHTKSAVTEENLSVK